MGGGSVDAAGTVAGVVALLAGFLLAISPVSKRFTLEDVSVRSPWRLATAWVTPSCGDFMGADPSALMLDEVGELENILRERLLGLGEFGIPHDLAGLEVDKLQHEGDRGGRRGSIVEALALAVPLENSIEYAINGESMADLQRIFIEILGVVGGRFVIARTTSSWGTTSHPPASAAWV